MFTLIILFYLLQIVVGLVAGYFIVIFLGWVLSAVVGIVDSIIKCFTGGY